jgi:hypothetical protein
MDEKLSPTVTSKSPLSFISHKMGPSLAIWAHSETIFFLIIFSFKKVDYIFYKLSTNTKKIQFQFCMSSWCIFISDGLWFHFSCILWEVLYATTCLNCPRIEGHSAKNEVLLPIESTLFQSCSWFYVMLSSMWPLIHE